ncbi:hypothetical protein [Nostoc sp. TCL26-01]|uniref:hypothetical protein n=1 Tax=Nostoc sp. TCL26-01 TaxID=2576904 RepID=UPI0015B8FFB3|nr:hypothetical protein [Nostoc sp. TCL26-01]QLE57540.1 hypothetical protein FD725_19690 [Nostoc sp. TCL26-01]
MQSQSQSDIQNELTSSINHSEVEEVVADALEADTNEPNNSVKKVAVDNFMASSQPDLAPETCWIDEDGNRVCLP